MNTEVCYLLHFDVPYQHARHYLGSALDLPARLAKHGSSQCNVRLLRAATAAGVTWQVARTWEGGRATERRLKGRVRGSHQLSRLCPLCGAWPRWGWRRGDGTMVGGFMTVAAELNRVYAPEPPVSRQQVAAWHYRRTRNKRGEYPPLPVRENPAALRTRPRFEFDTGHWVQWYGYGTRGPHKGAWIVREPVAA